MEIRIGPPIKPQQEPNTEPRVSLLMMAVKDFRCLWAMVVTLSKDAYSGGCADGSRDRAGGSRGCAEGGWVLWRSWKRCTGGHVGRA